VFMSGKSTFQRPASPDPKLRLFPARLPPAVAPTPVPKVTVSPAPSPITSHQPIIPSVSTSSSKRHRSPSPSRHRREKSARFSPSQQPHASRARSHECSSNQSQHHHVLTHSEPRSPSPPPIRSPSPPPILPETRSQDCHRPIHPVGPFDGGRDTVLYTEHDPRRGHFVKTTGAWYEERSHYPMPRKHWGRSDSFSPPPGPNRHLQPTRESFKSARGEYDEELRLNQYYWVRNSFGLSC
jgi:hypothetical protein